MIKFLAASLALVFATFGLAPRAEAARLPIVWGNHHNFDPIAPLKIPAELAGEVPKEWTEGGAELAHHSESFVIFWIAGFWLNDKGLAVHVPGRDMYWDVSEEDLKTFKELHLVPDPLPDTNIQPMTYLASFWGWLGVLAAVGIGAYIKSKI
jgi:hypothetical protein